LADTLDRLTSRLGSPQQEAQAAAREQAEAARQGGVRLAILDEARKALWAQRGRRYRECTLENFRTADPASRQIMERLREYRESIGEQIAAGVGVVLTGPVGTGKDHLLAALFDRAIDAGKSVQWVSGARLYARLRDGIGNDESEAKLLGLYSKPDVLVVSDPMPVAGQLTQYQRSTLYAIVDERYSNMRPIWCSINAASRREASEAIGEPIIDRLIHGAVSLACNWQSYRRPAE
jgi:DNA replication protein DnaC